MVPRTKRSGESHTGGRERLLAAALRLFAAKGYAGTSVRDVLRAAGVTAPVLYYHFGNKQGLFLALMQEGAERLHAALAEALARDGSAAAKARAYCLAVAAVRREHADLALVVEAVTTQHPGATPFFDPRGIIASVIEGLADVIRAGSVSGELRRCNPVHAALALLGTVEMVRRPFALAPGSTSLDEQLTGTLDLILAGLRATPGAAPVRSARPVRRRPGAAGAAG